MKEALGLVICMYIIGIAIFVLIGTATNPNNNSKDNIEVCDTVYNKVTLDSIEYNIVKRDTIIYKIKVKMMYEIKESKLISDSDAVKLFNSLVAE